MKILVVLKILKIVFEALPEHAVLEVMDAVTKKLDEIADKTKSEVDDVVIRTLGTAIKQLYLAEKGTVG